jgi:hypothetical protein
MYLPHGADWTFSFLVSKKAAIEEGDTCPLKTILAGFGIRRASRGYHAYTKAILRFYKAECIEQVQFKPRPEIEASGLGADGVATCANGGRPEPNQQPAAQAKGGKGGKALSARTPNASWHRAHLADDHRSRIHRRWAEERGAHPAVVKRTKGGKGSGVLRLEFPGYTGAESLEPIDWDQSFIKTFEDRKPALVYQEHAPGGEKLTFNKLVLREGA